MSMIKRTSPNKPVEPPAITPVAPPEPLIEKALALVPRQETVINAAAMYALAAGDMEKGFQYSKQAVKLNPHLIAWRVRLAQVHLQRKEFAEAVKECREAIQLNPHALRVRSLLINTLLQKGDKADAQKEYDQLLQLNPPNKADIQQWFEKERQRTP
jgi:Flp pilus assembly protein TadD